MSKNRQKTHENHEAGYFSPHLGVTEAPTALQAPSQESVKAIKMMSKKVRPDPPGAPAKIIVDEPPPITFTTYTKIKDPHGRAKSVKHEINAITVPKPD